MQMLGTWCGAILPSLILAVSYIKQRMAVAPGATNRLIILPPIAASFSRKEMASQSGRLSSPDKWWRRPAAAFGQTTNSLLTILRISSTESISTTKNYGMVSGSSGRVYRTLNGGQSWDTVQTATDTTVNSLRFLSDSKILAGTDDANGGLMTSSDSGKTWVYDANSLTFFYPAIKAVAVSAKDSFVAVGVGGVPGQGIILWHNGTFPQTDSKPSTLRSVAMASDSIAYIVGDSGQIYSNRAALAIGTNHANSAVRIFPNPASNVLMIEGRNVASAEISNAAGQRVFAGPVKAGVNVRNLAAGVYMVRCFDVAGQEVFVGKWVKE